MLSSSQERGFLIRYSHSWTMGLKTSKNELRKMAVSTPKSAWSRNWIVSAPGERMAARDAQRAHPAAAQPAVSLHRLVRVVRAGGVVAAGGRKDLGKAHLVAANQNEHGAGHGFA